MDPDNVVPFPDEREQFFRYLSQQFKSLREQAKAIEWRRDAEFEHVFEQFACLRRRLDTLTAAMEYAASDGKVVPYRLDRG